MNHWKTRDWASLITSVMFCACVIVTIIAYTYPWTILKVHSLKVLNSPAVAGGYLEYEVCYTKYLPFKANILVTLTNSSPQTLRERSADADVGSACKRMYVRIPSKTDEDTDYQLHWQASYTPTPISAPKVYRAVSQVFEIMADPCVPKGEKGDRGPRGLPGKNR
jgi:hypothetical protein